jgi:hypothetical protein
VPSLNLVVRRHYVVEAFGLDEGGAEAEVLERLVRLLIAHPAATADNLRCLATSLEAIQALPASAPDIDVEFGVVLRVRIADGGSESSYRSIHINASVIEVTSGGSSYDPEVGGDRFSGPSWVAEIGRTPNGDLDLFRLEDEVKELLNLGAHIETVDNLS